MDDYSLVSLSDSRNEWCARLVNTLTPCIIEGLKSIFDEAWKLCVENEEEDKYLMTFQTFLSRIPKWNPEIIENEKKRIEDTSSCGYLEELITCVHVIQLKALTCVRVGQQQKKVDIDIPSVDTFIHKIYCNVARKLYTSIYLFEKNLLPLEIQKHNRELEVIIRECILNTVRDTMPIENILRAYMDETEELDVNEEVVVVENQTSTNNNITPEELDIKQEVNEIAKTTEVPKELAVKKQVITSELSSDTPLAKPLIASTVSVKPTITEETVSIKPTPLDVVAPITDISQAVTVVSPASTPASTPALTPASTPAPALKVSSIIPPTPSPSPVVTVTDTVNFKDTDNAIDVNGNTTTIHAPKTDERLEEIANLSAERRRREEEEEEEEDKLKIGESVKLDITDINDLNRPVAIETAPILNDIEVLS